MPELTRPGCKDQYNHNVEVLERIEAAEKHIRDAELKEALMELAEGKKIVSKRQKLVQLADREEDGWAFVKEYKKDELASGSNDEKHMSKARAVASKKSKSKESRKARSHRTRPYSSQSFSRFKIDTNQRHKSNNFDRTNTNFRGNDFRQNKFDRQCYGCGRRGHLIYSCPVSKGRY